MATSLATMKRGLQTRQQVLRFLVRYHAEHGYAPSTREIADAVGLASTYSVRWHLDVLESEGYIRRASGVPRSISIINHPLAKQFLAEDLSFEE